LIAIGRALAAALFLAALAALAPADLVGAAMAQNATAALVAKPVSRCIAGDDAERLLATCRRPDPMLAAAIR
jgi:hypothetical protein